MKLFNSFLTINTKKKKIKTCWKEERRRLFCPKHEARGKKVVTACLRISVEQESKIVFKVSCLDSPTV